jgi:drug/metabolite transporter (DMT)-like permease
MWIVLVIICWVQKEPMTFPKGTALRANIQGFLSMGVYMILFLEGLSRTCGAEGAVILNTSPVCTALIAALAGQEKFRWGVLGGAALAFGGVALMVMGAGGQTQSAAQSQEHLLGVFMVLASAIVWATSTVISKPLLEVMTPIRLLTVSMPIAALVLVPYGIGPFLEVPWGKLSSTSWLTLAHVTFLAGVAGFIGFYAGVRKIGAPGAMLYQFFVPPLAALIEWLAFGKSLQPLQFLGFAVIVGGVLMASRARSSN